MSKVHVVLWTCPNLNEARPIIQALLEKKWIACANIIPKVVSLYSWNGKIKEAQEVLIFLKSAIEYISCIQDYIVAHCSYEVPEILQLEVKGGLKEYLEWVRSSTG